MIWTGLNFPKDVLVAAEGEILISLGFKLPAILGCKTLKEA
jgi:hypothetical protein